MAFRAGVVAVVGKPNVGKSTLMNWAVGQKVAITSSKPQTTRKAILGVANLPNAQIAFHDTPGIHRPKSALGKLMLDTALQTLREADAVLWVVDVSRPPDDDDKRIARLLRDAGKPAIVGLNKMDRLRPEYVESHYSEYGELSAPAEMMLTTALTGDNVNELLAMLLPLLPEAPPLFDDPDFYTNQTVRDLAAELVREQILANTREEVPHGIAVQIESWTEPERGADKPLTSIHAVIVVERESQKPILIGSHGSMLKRIGTQARLEIEKLLGSHVYLELFVKVRANWRDNPMLLRDMGLVE